MVVAEIASATRMFGDCIERLPTCSYAHIILHSNGISVKIAKLMMPPGSCMMKFSIERKMSLEELRLQHSVP